MNCYQLAKAWLIQEGHVHEGDTDVNMLSAEQEMTVRTRLGGAIGAHSPELWLLEAHLRTLVADPDTAEAGDDGDDGENDEAPEGSDVAPPSERGQMEHVTIVDESGFIEVPDANVANEGEDLGDEGDADEADEDGDESKE